MKYSFSNFTVKLYYNSNIFLSYYYYINNNNNNINNVIIIIINYYNPTTTVPEESDSRVSDKKVLWLWSNKLA